MGLSDDTGQQEDLRQEEVRDRDEKGKEITASPLPQPYQARPSDTHEEEGIVQRRKDYSVVYIQPGPSNSRGAPPARARKDRDMHDTVIGR